MGSLKLSVRRSDTDPGLSLIHCITIKTMTPRAINTVMTAGDNHAIFRVSSTNENERTKKKEKKKHHENIPI